MKINSVPFVKPSMDSFRRWVEENPEVGSNRFAYLSGTGIEEDAKFRGLLTSDLQRRLNDQELISTARRLNVSPLELHDRRYTGANGKIRTPQDSVKSLQAFTSRTLGPVFGKIVSDQIVNPQLTKNLNLVTDFATGHYKDITNPSLKSVANIATDFVGKIGQIASTPNELRSTL